MPASAFHRETPEAVYASLERSFHRSSVGRHQLSLLRRAWSSIYSVLSIGNRIKHPGVQCYRVEYSGESDDPVRRPGSTSWSETHLFLSFPAKRAVLFALSESSMHDRPDVFLPDEQEPLRGGTGTGTGAGAGAGAGVGTGPGMLARSISAPVVSSADRYLRAGDESVARRVTTESPESERAAVGVDDKSAIGGGTHGEHRTPSRLLAMQRASASAGPSIARPDSVASAQSWEARGRASPALARLRASASASAASGRRGRAETENEDEDDSGSGGSGVESCGADGEAVGHIAGLGGGGGTLRHDDGTIGDTDRDDRGEGAGAGTGMGTSTGGGGGVKMDGDAWEKLIE